MGTRLTWSSGDSTLTGVRLVPDPSGWLEQDGQFYSLDSSGGSGGVGLEQVDIAVRDAGTAVGDVRFLLATDSSMTAFTPSGFGVAVGGDDQLGEYWVAPATLAGLQPGVDGAGGRVWVGPRQVGDTVYDAVSVSTAAAGSYTSRTYDRATGYLLSGGSMHASPGVSILDGRGNLLQGAAGSVAMSHRRFVGARRLDMPWIGTQTPGGFSVGTTVSYVGSTGMSGFSQPFTVDYILRQDLGSAFVGEQVITADTGTGGAQPPTRTERVFWPGFDGLWIPPTALATLTAGQVLDQDPTSGRVTQVDAGSDGSTVIAVRSQVEDSAMVYDTSSGDLVAWRVATATAGGPQTTEARLLGD